MHTLLHSVPPTLQQATTDPHPCRRLLDPHGQVWVNLLWRHCSFLLGPGAHKVLFVPSKSLFPQSCVSSGGSMVGLTVPRRQGSHLFLCLFVLTAPQDMWDLITELPQDWGRRLLEGTRKPCAHQDPGERSSDPITDRPRLACVSRSHWWRRGLTVAYCRVRGTDYNSPGSPACWHRSF